MRLKVAPPVFKGCVREIERGPAVYHLFHKVDDGPIIGVPIDDGRWPHKRLSIPGSEPQGGMTRLWVVFCDHDRRGLAGTNGALHLRRGNGLIGPVVRDRVGQPPARSGQLPPN
jgi:hypothetical protein